MDNNENNINVETSVDVENTTSVENKSNSLQEELAKNFKAVENLKENLIPSMEQIEQIRAKLKGDNKAENTITLKDCVDLIDGFIEGSVSAEELDAFGAKMSIRAYIPILEKMATLMRILTQYEISAVESTEIKMVELYKYIFFIVVLGMYGQVQIDEIADKDLMTYENYDKLFPIFYSYILNYCKQDYDVFMQMFNDCVSWNGVVNITESMSNIDSDKLSEAVESNKKLVESMNDNKEMVSDIKDILLATDKSIKDVVKGIKEATVRDVIEQGKKNLEEKNKNVKKNGNNGNNVVSIDDLKKKQEESKQEVVVQENNKEDTEGGKPTPKKRGRPPKKKNK